MKKLIFLSIPLFILTACQSVIGPEIGMTEGQWLRRTLIADVAYMEENVKAYKSGRSYFYFMDGVLVKVDQGILPAQRIKMEVESRSLIKTEADDKYDKLKKLKELKEDGAITEDEFESEKKKILQN